MAISIEVRYSRTVLTQGIYAYMLRAEAIDSTDMPKEIFVFQRNVAPAVSINEQPTDQFVCIADPVDLQEFPVGSPDLQNEMPYYRSAVVELLFRDITTLTETQDFIGSDIELLIKSLKALANTAVQEEVIYD